MKTNQLDSPKHWVMLFVIFWGVRAHLESGCVLESGGTDLDSHFFARLFFPAQITLSPQEL